MRSRIILISFGNIRDGAAICGCGAQACRDMQGTLAMVGLSGVPSATPAWGDGRSGGCIWWHALRGAVFWGCSQGCRLQARSIPGYILPSLREGNERTLAGANCSDGPFGRTVKMRAGLGKVVRASAREKWGGKGCGGPSRNGTRLSLTTISLRKAQPFEVARR